MLHHVQIFLKVKTVFLKIVIFNKFYVGCLIQQLILGIHLYHNCKIKSYQRAKVLGLIH